MPPARIEDRRFLDTPARIEDTSYINSTAIRLCTISENSSYINTQHPKGNETKLTSISSAFDFETKYKCISHVDSTQQNTKLAELNQKRLNNSYEKNEVDLVSSQMTTTCDLKCSTSESEHSKCSNSKEELDSIYDNCDYTDTDSLNSHVDNQSEQTSYNDGSSKSVKDYENVTCYGSQKVFKSTFVRIRMDRLETVEHTSDQDRSSKSSEDYEIVESNDTNSCKVLIDDQFEQNSKKDRSLEDYEKVENYDTVSCNCLVDDQLEQNSDQDRSSESSEDYEKVKNNDSDSSNSLGNDQLGQTADKVRSSKSSEDYEKVDNYETFATLDVICDGMNLLCFVDRRLQMKYHQRLQIPTSSSNETVNGNIEHLCNQVHHAFEVLPEIDNIKYENLKRLFSGKRSRISSTYHTFVNQNFCDHTMLVKIRKRCQLYPGAVTGIKQNVTFDLQNNEDVNFQNIGQINVHANGSTFQPLLIAQPAHMQLPVGSLNEKRIFIMYNQMVMNIPPTGRRFRGHVYTSLETPH
ncbi:unnamed protein product [Mytilus edulis]|uniref:Uncharacterized protein n=1 Tax=Mytilus edulis TaxID=6550 RepID=A0A8S3RW59_MYTED|nr:unnamed protein product [Mytilus edulis]